MENPPLFPFVLVALFLKKQKYGDYNLPGKKNTEVKCKGKSLRLSALPEICQKFPLIIGRFYKADDQNCKDHSEMVKSDQNHKPHSTINC